MDQKSDKKARKIPFRAIGILFSSLAVIVLISIFYIGCYGLIAANQNVASDVKVLQQNLQQVNADLQNQSQVIAALRQAQPGNQSEWAMADAQYLVKLANDQLQFENNVPLSITLLQTAEKELADLQDPKASIIREALASDIAGLQKVPVVDMTALYLRLSALNQQLDKLPLPSQQTVDQTTLQSVDPTLVWWKRGLQQAWVALQKIVVVRYHANGAPALLSPEQKVFLYQNLHAIFEKMMWAVLHQNTEVFHASANQASDWIKLYFVQDALLTQQMLNELTQLESIDLHPAVPSITASMQAFSR